MIIINTQIPFDLLNFSRITGKHDCMIADMSIIAVLTNPSLVPMTSGEDCLEIIENTITCEEQANPNTNVSRYNMGKLT